MSDWYDVRLSYSELAHLLSWHHEQEKEASGRRGYVMAAWHLDRFEKLEEIRRRTDKATGDT